MEQVRTPAGLRAASWDRTSIHDFLSVLISQTLVLHPEESVGLSEEAEGRFLSVLLRVSSGCCSGRNEQVFVRQQDSLTVVVDDLRLCSVKPFEDIERRFCFEVVSPFK